jgi:hypothetical protein
MCVKCHATYVEKAQNLQGVGCERCHGPASGYLDFHSKTPKDRAGSIKLGMRDLFAKPATWVVICRDCHVLTDKKEYDALLDAGHKDGARWNVATKFVNVSTHWQKAPKYTAADITAAVKGVNTAAPPAPEPTKPEAAKPEEPKPEPTKPEAPKPDTAPKPNPPKPDAARPPAPKPDLVKVPGTGTRMADNNGSGTLVTPATTVISPLSLMPPPPVTGAALFAAFQTRVAALLESLLRKNTPPAAITPPSFSPPNSSGSNADLLRLQFEAVKLAVEALNLKVDNSAGSAKPPQK